MKPALYPAMLVTILLTAPCSQADKAEIIGTTDAASPIPGMTVISDYTGPLPPGNPPGRDIFQMPGFPTSMGSQQYFAPARGLVFADLDGDGDLEIVTSSTDDKVYAWDYTGNLVPGFPVTTIEQAQYAPSVADMDGDGDMEIVQLTRGTVEGGRLYIIDHEGNVLPGFPVSVNNNNLASCATLYDLDGDGIMEIIVGERDWPLGYLHVFEIDGSEWGGNWPVTLDHVPTGTAAVGDVDADGVVEIFYMSFDSMYLLEVDGSSLPGWPRQITDANFSYQSAALADLDNDGDLEIVVGAHKTAAGCYVFHHDGATFPGWPKLVGSWTYCAPTVTDLDGDGELEILDGRTGNVGDPTSEAFWAWTVSGVTKPGFPYMAPEHGGGSDGPLTVADINGDGLMEIFADHNVTVEGYGYLFGVDAAGGDLPGFPLRPHGFTYMNGATIGDVDGDGDYEIGVLSVHGTTVDVNLYDLTETYAPTNRDWKVYHARNQRGGLYEPTSQCPGDLDGDGDTDQSDLGLLLSSYDIDDGGDLDGDGDTDQSDLGILLSDYGCTP